MQCAKHLSVPHAAIKSENFHPNTYYVRICVKNIYLLTRFSTRYLKTLKPQLNTNKTTTVRKTIAVRTKISLFEFIWIFRNFFFVHLPLGFLFC